MYLWCTLFYRLNRLCLCLGLLVSLGVTGSTGVTGTTWTTAMGHHNRPVIWSPCLPMHPLCLLCSLFVLSGTDRYVKECQDRAQALKGRELLLQQTLPTKEESKESQKSTQNEDGEETYISPTSLRVSGDCVLFANGHSKMIIDDETFKCYCGQRCEEIRH